MIILGVDVETSTHNKNAEVVEIGFILFDTSNNQVINTLGRILPTKTWDKDTAKVHGINKKISAKSSEFNFNPYGIIDADMAEYMVAHNAEFDKPIITEMWPEFNKKKWICTFRDLDHSSVLYKVTSQRLGHLAADYGINIGSLHRATYDAELSCRIAAFHNLDVAYKEKSEPHYDIVIIGKYNKEYISKIKTIGFYWNADDRFWYKYRVNKKILKEHLLFIKNELSGWNAEVVEHDMLL